MFIQQTFDARKNFMARERLFHEIIGADARAEKLFRRLLVATHHDDGDVLGAFVAAQGAQGSKAVDAGHHDVEKDEFGMMREHQFQTGSGIQRRDGRAARRLQNTL